MFSFEEGVVGKYLNAIKQPVCAERFVDQGPHCYARILNPKPYSVVSLAARLL